LKSERTISSGGREAKGSVEFMISFAKGSHSMPLRRESSSTAALSAAELVGERRERVSQRIPARSKPAIWGGGTTPRNLKSSATRVQELPAGRT
jgi:hypothetical protein